MILYSSNEYKMNISLSTGYVNKKIEIKKKTERQSLDEYPSVFWHYFFMTSEIRKMSLL